MVVGLELEVLNWNYIYSLQKLEKSIANFPECTVPKWQKVIGMIGSSDHIVCISFFIFYINKLFFLQYSAFERFC